MDEKKEIIDLESVVVGANGRPRASGLIASRRQQQEKPAHKKIERTRRKKPVAADKTIRATESDYKFLLDVFHDNELDYRHEALTIVVDFYKEHYKKNK